MDVARLTRGALCIPPPARIRFDLSCERVPLIVELQKWRHCN